MSKFVLGEKSLTKLAEGEEPLQRVVKRAITLSETDFSVYEVLRAMARQQMLVKSGASTTLNSKHLADKKSGKSRAADLVPYYDTDGNGTKELSWHWPHAYQIASAMQKAARLENVAIRWGGVWDKNLNDLTDDLEVEVAQYVLRQKVRNAAAGKKDRPVFIDGPHFELA